MAPNRVPKPSGWKGGSDDFDVLSTGYTGRIGIEKDEDYSLDEICNRKNLKRAGEAW